MKSYLCVDSGAYIEAVSMLKGRFDSEKGQEII